MDLRSFKESGDAPRILGLRAGDPHGVRPDPSPQMTLVAGAAAALGGRDRLVSIKTLTIHGYGQQAYQNGGGNITASLDAPQKWVNVNGLKRTIDFEHNRMRLQQRVFQDFVFAYVRNMTGQNAVQGLDGNVAFNVNPDGRAVRAGAAALRARRLEMLNNPVAIVRAALDPATKLSNLRRMGSRQVLDLTTPPTMTSSPWHSIREYGKYVTGIVTGREMDVGTTVSRVRRSVLGFSHRSRGLTGTR